MSETALVAGCLVYLQSKGCMAWRNNTGGVRKGRHFIRFGHVGSSDIIGVGPGGFFIGVECKRGSNTLTVLQQQFLDDVLTQGGWAVCVYSVDELEQVYRRRFGV